MLPSSPSPPSPQASSSRPSRPPEDDPALPVAPRSHLGETLRDERHRSRDHALRSYPRRRRPPRRRQSHSQHGPVRGSTVSLLSTVRRAERTSRDGGTG